jgi:Bifunctional DNA primase/polymerase, N-terminal
MRIDDYSFGRSDTANVADSATNAIAKKYHDRGWFVTPVAYRAKEPILKGWPNTRLTIGDLDSHFEAGPMNIGIVLGDLSHGLVDVDIDDPQAIYFVDHFLPHTDAIFGRASNLRSHRIYKVPSPGRHLRFDSPVSLSLNCVGTDTSPSSRAPSMSAGRALHLRMNVMASRDLPIGVDLVLRASRPPFRPCSANRGLRDHGIS